jgi:hypothetical protein
MTGMPWCRLYAEAVDDEKLRLLAFEDRWHFIALLCCKTAGILDAGDEPAMLQRKLAVKLGLQLRELEAMALRLAEVGLIDASTFQPAKWGDRQFQSDTSTERVRAYRERMKRCGNVSETAQETDTDTEPKQSKSKPQAAMPTVPDWIDADAWSGFAESRKRARHPMTARAAELVIRELRNLAAAGHDANAVLDQSTRNGWRDVFPIRSTSNGATHEAARRSSAAERVRHHAIEGERADRGRAAQPDRCADLVGADG